jgi:plastocyanin
MKGSRLRAAGFATVLAALSVAVMISMLGASAQTLPPGGTFTDDDLNVHEGFIEAIAAEGITAGCDASGTLYCPAGVVTRAQMATFLARALGLPASTTDWFPDDNGSVHEPNINAVADAGISLGRTDGTFGPNDAVLRGQMASFLARGFDGLTAATMDYFTDDEGIVHEDAINTMAENAITIGCDATGTVYCPYEAVHRDQMATFMGRALGLDEIIPPPTTTTTTTTTTQASQTFTVSLLDSPLSFSPSSRTISSGDSILFSKQTSGFHNVQFTGGSTATSGDATTDTFTWKITFSTPGTYSYVCEIHEGNGMTGTVTVTG